MFKFGAFDPANSTVVFGEGGFQGARGSNDGGDFFVENIFEELDARGEFFFRDGKLYVATTICACTRHGQSATRVKIYVPYFLLLVLSCSLFPRHLLMHVFFPLLIFGRVCARARACVCAGGLSNGCDCVA